MSLRIDLTTGFSQEEMEPLWSSILECLERYVARFPTDETVQGILDQIVKGKRQLWIVRDETGRVILTPITEIVKIDTTGKTKLFLAEVGGERLAECMPLLSEIERWAKEKHGATESELIGRPGWKKMLEPLSYRLAAHVYTKAL